MMVMKKRILISVGVTILIFLLSFGFNSASDGNNSMGFPFSFYEYSGGKRYPEPETRHNFIVLAFITDVLIVAGTTFAITYLIQRRNKVKGDF
jgi:hypothetical protein